MIQNLRGCKRHPIDLHHHRGCRKKSDRECVEKKWTRKQQPTRYNLRNNKGANFRSIATQHLLTQHIFQEHFCHAYV